MARFLHQLGSVCRVAVLDKQGTCGVPEVCLACELQR